MRFTTLEEYPTINAGAHRKPASIIGPPAVMSHIGFWRPDSPQRKAEFLRCVKSLKRKLFDQGILAGDVLGSKINPRAHTFTYNHRDWLEQEPSADSSSVSIIRFWWHGFFCTVRLCYQTEYTTLTCFIDLSAKRLADCPESAPLVRRMLGALRQLEAGFSSGQYDDPEGLARELQIGMWHDFFVEIFDSKTDKRELLGKIFVDIRGVLTGSQDRTLRTSQKMSPAFRNDVPRRRTRTMQYSASHDLEWARKCVKRLWPVIEYDAAREYEFSVTTLLGGRAVLATASGPQLDDDQTSNSRHQDDEWMPIKYFLHSYGDDEWQIGRLVDRLHAAGTLRVAAVMDIAQLRAVGADVESLAGEIDRTGTAIQHAIEHEHRSRTLGLDASRQKPQGKAVRALAQPNPHELMQRIDRRFSRINRQISGNIFNRLERSQAYMEQFREETGAWRQGRVEGYQMYPEFMARRLSSTISYLGLLKVRMDETYSQHTKLRSQYATLKLKELTHNIERIQDIGEIALIGVLIPYYVTAALYPDTISKIAFFIFGNLIVFLRLFQRFWKGRGSLAFLILHLILAAMIIGFAAANAGKSSASTPAAPKLDAPAPGAPK